VDDWLCLLGSSPAKLAMCSSSQALCVEARPEPTETQGRDWQNLTDVLYVGYNGYEDC
jgi:hypothetical protein